MAINQFTRVGLHHPGQHGDQVYDSGKGTTASR